MIRATILTSCMIAASAAVVAPLNAQTPAPPPPPKAKSVAIFTPATHSYLGIGVVDVSDERAKALNLKEPQGVEVTSVSDDSPAAKAGIKEGDVIVEFDGQRVSGGQQFVRMVRETPVGRKVNMQVWRNGAKTAASATIASRQERAFTLSVPTPPEAPSVFMPNIQIPDLPRDLMSWRSSVLGVESESLTSQLAEFFGVKDGVLVRAVIKGSAAETAGLKAGDIITKINGETVSSPRNVAVYLHKSGKDVTVTVVRNRKEITLNVKLAENFHRLDDFLPREDQEPRKVL